MNKITVYGIANCDIIRKTIQWYCKKKIGVDFHDYKKLGIRKEKLAEWCKEVGWETLLNKRSTTFRTLPAEEQQRFRVMIDEADDRVIQWGITQVANWKQELASKNLIHIHGDHDLVFRIRKIKADHVIKNGKHFMIMREISEINELIMSLLQTESVQSH